MWWRSAPEKKVPLSPHHVKKSGCVSDNDGPCRPKGQIVACPHKEPVGNVGKAAKVAQS